MSDLQIYKVTPRQTKAALVDILEAGLVPFLQSSPGMGKSEITQSVSDDFGLILIDHRLSTSEPTDLTGLANFLPDGTAAFSPFRELFPLSDMDVPEGSNGWMLFLDEFTSAHKSVQAAAYKLILDRKVGQFKLHENVAIVCAGNLATDRAIVNTMSTAMQSRLIHLEMEINFDEWLYDVALKQKYDRRIIAYLSQYHSELMDFNPSHNEKTFCCPRTWSFLNRLIQGTDAEGNRYEKEVTNKKIATYAGTITSGVALKFVQFCKIIEKMINVAEIEADPEHCRMPGDASLMWATITHMMEYVTKDSLPWLATYANRMTMDFKVLFFRSVMVQHPELRHEPAMVSALVALGQYLQP